MRCGRMVHGGVCLARLDSGEPLMVENGVPDELVDVQLRFRKGRTWFGGVSRVREASPHRVTPPCPYVPDCGGCQLQHITYPHQVALKRDILLDALRRQGVAPSEVAVHGAASAFSYRWRGEFHIVPGDAGLSDASLGFNRARSWTPIAVDDCLIHHDAIRAALPELRRLVRDGGSTELRVLHVTCGDDGAELLVRGKPRRALAADVVDDVSLRIAPRRLSTEATTLTWRGLVFRATPDTFIQVNWEQMDVLYQCAVIALGEPGGRIVDAYAGIGVLPVHLAARGAAVTCIESNLAAATAGMHNAAINGVADRVRYVHGAAEHELPRTGDDVGALILDPPRAGCAGGVTGWLALAGPPVVVYISCDPATLARDLHLLVASGPYTLQRLDVIDMFPQTYHVECVAQLVRQCSAERASA